ncbi:ATP-binding protein [Kitasatospora sp. NPDC008050]|uniref:ATP-binding protein n=1 Tax=Kitasatospora sp. NPDC008050 TaxID=3364021 RepID=UPI0036EF44D0
MESQQRFGIGAELPDDDREPECAPGHGLHAVLDPADLAAIAPLRAALRAALGHWGVPELADTAELLASELLANALQHTGGGAVLDARLGTDRRLRVEVRDGGAQLPRPRRAPETATSGRGLLLVEVLADGWGVRRHADGKITWFELAPAHP